MSNLRKKYKKKTAKVSKLKEKQEKENSLIGSKSFSDFLEFEDGKTIKVRLLPAKEEEFYILRRVCWLTIEDEDGDEVRRTIPSSILHGNTKKDLIEEYIKFVNKNVKDKEKLKALKDWKNGISFDNEWISYALKIKGSKRDFGLISFKKTVRDAINKEMFVEDEDDPIEVDPFTDVDDGFPLLIKYLSKPNKKRGEEYYTVKLGKKAVPVRDEELEKLEEAKSLEELFRNNFTMQDFENSLNGLKIFDMNNEIDIFEDDEWLEIVEDVKSQYDSSEEDEEQEEDYEEELEEDEVEEELYEEEEDEFDEMSRIELRKYIKKEKLDIKVLKSMGDDEIRNEIRLAYEEDELEEEEDLEEEVEEAEEVDEAEEEKPKGRSSIAEIRKKLAEKSKKK